MAPAIHFYGAYMARALRAYMSFFDVFLFFTYAPAMAEVNVPHPQSVRICKIVEKPKENIWKQTYHYTNAFKIKAKHTKNMFFIHSLINEIVSFFAYALAVAS